MRQEYLLRCIELATKRLGFCAPNPAVGAVVVKDNKIIAEGFHWGCGYAHAEVDALNKISEEDAHGATLYVSLEPCCHYGRTPPCTERIKNAGIQGVYYGFKDPNPIVTGKGHDELMRAGIHCEHIALPEIDAFYAPYQYWTLSKKPFVTAKLAMSIDYKIARADKKPVQMTGEACRVLTHQYRTTADAILTTAETIIHDDPQLNARINEEIISKNIYILDSRGRLPLTSKILNTAQSITLFHAANVVPSLAEKNCCCIAIEESANGLNLHLVLEKIGTDGVHYLWVEAGATCFNAFLNQGLLNRVVIYVSPNTLGDDALPANIDLDQINRIAKNCLKCTSGNDTVYFYDLN